MQKTVILYHADCPDGFGGAYAAWKKFGGEAEYIPVKYGRPVPSLEPGRELFFVDFCYPKETMDELAKDAASITVLDHHEGVKDVIQSFPNHVYDPLHSGAVIAWDYFHPGVQTPELLRLVETGDLYAFDLPDARALLSYIYTKPFRFEDWENLSKELEDPGKRAAAVERGTIYFEYYSLTVERLVARAELVEFEGHTVYLGTGASIFNSDVGHALVEKQPPFALVAGVAHDGIRVSLRGNGTIDVSELARRHGGNGHPNSAAFFIRWGNPLPWKPHTK